MGIRRNDGNVQITTFDYQLKEITNVIIPGNTRVQAARNLGFLPLKNIWELGNNEGMGGLLLAETLTRHFKFPMTAWADAKATGLSSSNIFLLAKAILWPYQTNLKIGDKLRLAFFSLGVKPSGRLEINLEDTGYLNLQRFVDGEEGYVVSGIYPDHLRVTFSNPRVTVEKTRVVIIDAGGEDTADNLGEVIEILGAKVISIEKKDLEKTDCLVRGIDKEIVEVFARLFSCELEIVDSQQGSLEIKIGSEFASRY